MAIILILWHYFGYSCQLISYHAEHYIIKTYAELIELYVILIIVVTHIHFKQIAKVTDQDSLA